MAAGDGEIAFEQREMQVNGRFAIFEGDVAETGKDFGAGVQGLGAIAPGILGIVAEHGLFQGADEADVPLGDAFFATDGHQGAQEIFALGQTDKQGRVH